MIASSGSSGHLRELLDLGRVQREVREAVVLEKDGGLMRKALRGGETPRPTRKEVERSIEVD